MIQQQVYYFVNCFSGGWWWQDLLSSYHMLDTFKIITFVHSNWGASWVAQWSRVHPPVQETWVRSLGQEDPLEKEMATHSSILAWKILWTEEPGGLQSMGSQKVRHNSYTQHMHTHNCMGYLCFWIHVNHRSVVRTDVCACTWVWEREMCVCVGGEWGDLESSTELWVPWSSRILWYTSSLTQENTWPTYQILTIGPSLLLFHFPKTCCCPT